MKKNIFFFVLLFSFLLFTPGKAQNTIENLPAEPTKLEPKIKADNFVRINKKTIFDASKSVLLPGIPAEFYWQIADSSTKIAGQEIVQEFSEVGYQNITLTINQGENTSSVSKEIFIFDNRTFLIIDEKKQSKISELHIQAIENGVALNILPITENEGVLLTEDALSQKIKEASEFIQNSDYLIFYTESALGTQAFNRYFQELNLEMQENLRSKFFVIISDGNLNTIDNLAFQTFKIIEPEYILVTRKEALSPLLAEKDNQEIIDVLRNRGIEYHIIDERGEKPAIFFVSRLTTYLVTHGTPSNIIYIILIVPFLTAIVALARQVIGIGTFGIYTPVIISLCFFILGLWLGLMAFFLAVFVSYLIRFILNKLELLYLPKMALNLALISLSFLLVVWAAVKFESTIPLTMAIFPLLVMSTIAEKFMAAQSEEGLSGALFGVLGTLLIVIVSYYFITWTNFNKLLLAWPELVITPFLLNFLLGKFTGLRLSEYLRFRSLFTEHQE